MNTKIWNLVLALSLFTACGNSDSGPNQTESPSGTSSPSEEVLNWESVNYKWISHWAPCKDNNFKINRDSRIVRTICGEVTNAAISDQDLDLLEAQIKPIAEDFESDLECVNKTIVDWAVYTNLTVGSQTKEIYLFDADQNCVRGNRIAVEQLQKTLEMLNNKYFGR